MRMERLLVAAVVATAVSIAIAAPAAAFNNPYSGNGYDASSFQCSNGSPATLDPSYASFAIIRLTGGRPFTVDTCLQALWDQASASTTRPPSVYVSAAYSGAYRRQVSTVCSTATSPEGYTGKSLEAYRIGCSEGDFAFAHRPSGTAPAAWWLDVETANSWSTSDKQLNEAAINGAVDRLASVSGVPVGVYSSSNAWDKITSGPTFAPANAAASWVAGAAACNSSFSAGLTQWLRQIGTTSTGQDADYAC